MNELKSCAHCGSEVNLDFGISGNPFIGCGKCRLDMGGESRKEITEKWNCRASPWVRVEDGLPEDGEFVLMRAHDIFDKEGLATFLVAAYFNSNIFRTMDKNAHLIRDVTHWMPIPELPEIKE